MFFFKMTWLSDLCNVLLQLVDLSEEMGMFGSVLFHLFQLFPLDGGSMDNHRTHSTVPCIGINI